MSESKYKSELIVVDETTILNEDWVTLIAPMTWTIDIYKDFDVYEKSKSKFTQEQINVFLCNLYDSEIRNGGHYQFFYNSSGIIYVDLLKALLAIGANDHLNILKKALNKFKSPPSFDKALRQIQVDEVFEKTKISKRNLIHKILSKLNKNLNNKHEKNLENNFKTEDKEFYSLDYLGKIIVNYIKENPTKFKFSGNISRPK